MPDVNLQPQDTIINKTITVNVKDGDTLDTAEILVETDRRNSEKASIGNLKEQLKEKEAEKKQADIQVVFLQEKIDAIKDLITEYTVEVETKLAK